MVYLLQDGAARPMTAVRAAGYTSKLTRGTWSQYPGQQHSQSFNKKLIF